MQWYLHQHQQHQQPANQRHFQLTTHHLCSHRKVIQVYNGTSTELYDTNNWTKWLWKTCNLFNFAQCSLKFVTRCHAIAKMIARCAEYMSALKIVCKHNSSRRLRKNLHITILSLFCGEIISKYMNRMQIYIWATLNFAQCSLKFVQCSVFSGSVYIVGDSGSHNSGSTVTVHIGVVVAVFVVFVVVVAFLVVVNLCMRRSRRRLATTTCSNLIFFFRQSSSHVLFLSGCWARSLAYPEIKMEWMDVPDF